MISLLWIKRSFAAILFTVLSVHIGVAADEPSLVGVPVVYGPQVHAQLPLHELLTAYKASIQVASTDALFASIIALTDTPALRAGMTSGANTLRDDSRGLNARIATKILKIARVNMV